MALEHKLYIDIDASPHAIRDLLREGGRFEEDNDFQADRPGLLNERTSLSISEGDALDREWLMTGWKRDIEPSRKLYFRCRGGYQNAPAWDEDVFASVGLVLQAYPDADAFMMEGNGRPVFVRRAGHLILSADLSCEGHTLDPKSYPYAGLLGLPYTVGVIDME